MNCLNIVFITSFGTFGLWIAMEYGMQVLLYFWLITRIHFHPSVYFDGESGTRCSKLQTPCPLSYWIQVAADLFNKYEDISLQNSIASHNRNVSFMLRCFSQTKTNTHKLRRFVATGWFLAKNKTPCEDILEYQSWKIISLKK